MYLYSQFVVNRINSIPEIHIQKNSSAYFNEAHNSNVLILYFIVTYIFLENSEGILQKIYTVYFQHVLHIILLFN